MNRIMEFVSYIVMRTVSGHGCLGMRSRLSAEFCGGNWFPYPGMGSQASSNSSTCPIASASTVSAAP